MPEQTHDEAESREAYIPQEDRDKIDEADFGDPDGRKFPIRSQQDVHDAARLIGKAGNPDAVKRRILAICKRKGFSAPEAWRADDDESESREAVQPIPTVVDPPSERERLVRESTVQDSPSLRANIVREGRGYRIKGCQLLSAGPGNALYGNTYEPEAVEALVREVQRQPKAFCDHSLPSEVRERGHRSLRDLAGIYDKRTVRYDPSTQACLADLIVRPTVYDEYVAPVLEAGDNLGISVDGIGHCPERPRHVKGWKRFNSADLVPAGGARGFIVRESQASGAGRQASEKEFAMGLLDDVTATDVRESAPALFEEIGKQYAHATGGNSPAPTTHPAPAAPDGQHSARLAALEARVREAEERAALADERAFAMEAAENKRYVAAHIESLVRESLGPGADDKQVAYVTQRYRDATMGSEGTFKDQESLEATVREDTEEYKATLPAEPKGGQILGLGLGTPGKFSTPARQDKVILDAYDYMFPPAGGGGRVQPPATGPSDGGAQVGGGA